MRGKKQLSSLVQRHDAVHRAGPLHGAAQLQTLHQRRAGFPRSVLREQMTRHLVAENKALVGVDAHDAFVQDFHHPGHPGKALVVPAHGHGDIDGLVQGPFQIAQTRHDDDGRAVLRLRHFGADAAPHDAADPHPDGRGDALHMLPRGGEQNGKNGNVQQLGKGPHPLGNAFVAGDGNGRTVLARLHQAAQHGKMIVGNGHDGTLQPPAQQTARPAAPQNDFHAVFQQFPRHGQGLFHGGKTYLHPHAATLGILPDGLGYGAGIGNKGEAKRMLGHEASRGCCSRDNAG